VPAGVVTAIGPVVAPVGTVALSELSETSVKVVLLPLKVTALVSVKPLPLIVTLVPAGPLLGLNEEIVGGGGGVVTVKLVALVAVPVGVVTAIGPVVAPVGTFALSELSEMSVKVALVPLKVTALVPVKPLPLIVTLVPAGPLLGLNEEIVGGGGGGEPAEVGVTANSHVRQAVDDVVPPATLYWFPSQTWPTLPPPAVGSGLAPE